MSFDKTWEKKVYKKKLQINKYPFDQVVSLVNKFCKEKNKVKNSRVIELGCGTGNNLNFLNDFGFKLIVGIDGSASAIKLAKKNLRAKNYKLLNSDFNNIPFERNFFNLCIDRGSITHNSKLSVENIFYQINKVLKPSGIFISFLFSKKDSLFLENRPKTSRGNKIENILFTSFFDQKEIKKLFRNFKILHLVHEVKFNKLTKKNNAMWIVVAKNKI